MLKALAAILLGGFGLLILLVFGLPTLAVLASPGSQGLVPLLVPFLVFGLLFFLAGLRLAFGPIHVPTFLLGLGPRKTTSDVDGHLARVADRHLDELRRGQPRHD